MSNVLTADINSLTAHSSTMAQTTKDMLYGSWTLSGTLSHNDMGKITSNVDEHSTTRSPVFARHWLIGFNENKSFISLFLSLLAGKQTQQEILGASAINEL
jgi:hypothetical protein